MKIVRLTAMATLMQITLVAMTSAQAVDNELRQLAMKHIPAGMVLAHAPVKGYFAGMASRSPEKIVVLYGSNDPVGGYEGLVLFPNGSAGYEEHRLPKPEFTWSMMKPITIFFANADSDPANELFIIEECMTGVGPEGAKPFYRTRVYDWTADGFVHKELLSEAIGDLPTASAIRRQLPAFIVKVESRFEPMDADQMNRQLDQNSAARSPLQVIATIIEPFEEMLSRNVFIKAPTVPDADTLMVTVTDDGYADDSVRGMQYSIKLYKNTSGAWRVSEASKGWRCQEGRGHQGFSSKPCL